MVARSCRCAFPVCTVTTFFLLWYTVKLTMPIRRTATPAPIAIFFQAFITPHQPEYLVSAVKCRQNVILRAKTSFPALRVTDTHPLIRSCPLESSEQVR